ncbi:nuclear mRNA export protein PCID2/THP1 [Marchantia polymorpha subsp. ruderalis]|uniref:PCI domain-containing protein n=2 Tax=Marchantia polymorpha TaxID=3197 RepID=A0AAF6ALH5_MARPO|nr:hypothetical protein MARPO_0005s0151 [Marchantia polymorpha]BBM97295.1 hypothetical protein Mp_1g04560 [Marchantia polymorpha subsp. ruderalis]|eukprot:PTQ48511.1 hypothetical protein MARPO_0005s0151 [Marchantia polymorpha]
MAYGSIEGQKRLQDYVNRFIDALTSQNGTQLSALLAITSSPFRDAVGSALDLVKDPSRIIKQVDKHAPLGEMLGHHIRCMQAYRHRRYLDAYNSLEKSANPFLQEFRNWESAWAMKALHTVVFELRTLAELADREMANNGKVPDKLKGAGSFLMKVFGALAGKGPKRVGALYVTCQLFKVYFKLGTVHLCRSVIRSIETARVFDFEEFPTRDKVTYMYYTGRLEVFNDNFIQADKKLWYALGHCDPSKDANIRMILKYLVPVKLSLGILPNEWLLRKYHIMEYNDIVQALRRGDIRLLRYALQANEDQFLRSGVYLVLEKLELQVYQRLMKKIHLIQKQKDPSKAHQIKMDSILKALKWLQIDMDIDEVECIMATLIHKNLMRGYLSHKSKVVVLSKQDPFPLLSGKPCA